MKTFDERTEKNIATLHPAVQPLARAMVEKAQAYLGTNAPGTVVKIISGYRTYAEQDKLYAQGRSTPGSVVTNARGGYSNHNFRLSFDIGLFQGTKYLDDSPLYKKLGAIGKGVGLAWGGDWHGLVDTPHYELPHGLTLAVLRSRCDAQGNPKGDLLAGTKWAASKPAPTIPDTTPPAAKYPTWKVYLPDGKSSIIVEHDETDVVRAISEAFGGRLTVDSTNKKIVLAK